MNYWTVQLTTLTINYTITKGETQKLKTTLTNNPWSRWYDLTKAVTNSGGVKWNLRAYNHFWHILIICCKSVVKSAKSSIILIIKYVIEYKCWQFNDDHANTRQLAYINDAYLHRQNMMQSSQKCSLNVLKRTEGIKTNQFK